MRRSGAAIAVAARAHRGHYVRVDKVDREATRAVHGGRQRRRIAPNRSRGGDALNPQCSRQLLRSERHFKGMSQLDPAAALGAAWKCRS